jgi:hypothetical protein
MVASAVFLTDLNGKSIISRNYRGEIPLTKAIDRFAQYLVEVDDQMMKPVFNVDANGDFMPDGDVGSTGVGGHTFVYVQVRIDNCQTRSELQATMTFCGGSGEYLSEPLQTSF